MRRAPFLALLCVLAQFSVACAQPARAPWMDKALPPDRRADLLLAQMTIDEMLSLVDGHYAVPATWKNPANVVPPGALGSAGFVPGIPRLGIPPLQETDGGVGVAEPIDGTTGKPIRGTAGFATPLPSALALAATWNTDIAEHAGAMIGEEARRQGFNVLLAGGVNLARDPRNGRNFEYAGEDPLLAGLMVGHAIRGIQSRHVLATAKHFALNDQETGRENLSAGIAWPAARESDLLAFEIAIGLGQPGAVMCAYNKVNGVPACGSADLLTRVLKQDWRFPGWVMSDWGAVHSTLDANAGLDQESGDFFDQPKIWFSAARLKAAIAGGAVPQARLRDMARRILRAMFATGLFDDPPVIAPIDIMGDAAVAQSAAEHAIVLLKNDADLLPLDGGKIGSIAVIGGHADAGVLAGGGSSSVWPIGGPARPIDGTVFPHPILWDPSPPLPAIQAEAPRAAARFADGRDIAAAARLASSSDVALVFATQWMAESIDAPDLNPPDNQDALIAAVAAANPRTVVVLETGGPVVMPWLDRVAGVIEAWYPGARGGAAIAAVLFGRAPPAGRLPITFPRDVAQLPRPAPPRAAPEIDYDIEGSAVGYRWFDRQHFQPLFPFGFGLSTTRFGYANFSVRNESGRISARFDVTNAGRRDGWDTPQIYVRVPDGSASGALRLGGFAHLFLRAGETRTLDVPLEPRLLASFGETARQWMIRPGAYDFLLGGSSRDFALRQSLDLPAVTLPP